MSNSEKNESVKDSKKGNRSILKIISFNLMYFSFLSGFGFLTAYGQYFYEVEVGFPIALFTIVYIIFGFWDAINDPIIGYLSDKTHFYTRRFGRRFLWIVIGTLPVTPFLFLIFSPPAVDPVADSMVIFFWLLIFLLVYELFLTAGQTNWWALYPQMFRSDRDRRYSTGMELIIWAIALMFGFVIPPIFIEFGNRASFATAAILVILVSIPLGILGIPGVHEDKRMIERVFKAEQQDTEKKNYFKVIKIAFKNRNFLAMMVIWTLIQTFAGLLIGSTFFYVRYVLKTDEIVSSLLLFSWLIAAAVSAPFWIWVVNKLGEIKVFTIANIGIAVTLVPLIFSRDVILSIILFAVIGAFSGGFQLADEPLMGSVYDQIVEKERRHLEGSIGGIQTVLLRVSGPLSVSIIAIMQVFTGFDPVATLQTPLAEWGIVLAFTLVGIILVLLGYLIWRLLWKLTEENRKALKTKLKELDL